MNTKIKNITVSLVLAILMFGLSAWTWLREADDFSESERRSLAQFPELSTETVLSGKFMSEFETYTQDQFPLRDSFRRLKALAAFGIFGNKDNNDIYVADGHISKLEYPMSEPMLDHAEDRFENLYNKYLSGNENVYFAIIPDKNYFLAEKNGYLSLDYDRLIADMYGRLENMKPIDVIELLDISDYYYTDTHWRQEKILDVAEAIAKAMGVTLSAEYEENTLDHPFYGVYYGQSALPYEPDTIKYLTNEMLEGCTVTSYNTGVPKKTVMYNMEKAVSRDPYEMFLGGADPLIVIENPAATSDRELVVFRDSFGSSFVPLLVEAYAKVTVVDTRYMDSSLIGNFVEFHEEQDVLFMYSTMLINNSLAIR